MLAESGRFVGYAARRFSDDRCTQAAAALTYTSLLALVPLMTITISVVSAFPAFQNIEASAQQLIFDNLVPQVGTAVWEYLERFVANAGKLTAVGLIGLVVTAILLLATIESAFNNIWRVRESRPWLVRLLSFWAILTLTPVMFAASLSMTSQFMKGSVLGAEVLDILPFFGLLPVLFEFIGFTALYWVIPNRPVLGRDAAAGGLIAAILLELSKAGFATYLTSFPVYETIYGAVSTVPIFLVWLYLAWSIVLIGALTAAALPDWRAGRLIGGDIWAMSPAQRIVLGFSVVRQLAGAARLGVGVKRKTLLRRLPLASAMLEDMLQRLKDAHFVERTASDSWLLSRDPSTATLYDLVVALGAGIRGTRVTADDKPTHERRVADLLRSAENGQQEALNVALAELIADPENLPATPLRLGRRSAAEN